VTDIRTLAAGVIASGFGGPTLSAGLAAEVDRLGLAGWILFARNVESLAQTRALTDAIRARYPDDLPPVLAIDQEGGRVARLRDGVEVLPAMMAVAATGDETLARRAGEQLGFDLRRAGFNVDYAPVLDLALERMNTVIGSRSFGADPERVARFAGAFGAGLEAGGMIATYKHFPGHGSTALDSHLELPVIDVDEATLRARDLIPFERLLPDAKALMTAHIVAPAFDGAAAATLSERLLTGVLRDEIGFGGVTFTDCMQMDAIARTVGSARGAVLALAAGADCVLISHSLAVAEEAIAAIEAAVADGTLSRARLEEAHARVTALRRGLAAPLPIDALPPHPGIGREIGRRAVTVVSGAPRGDAAGDVVVSFQGTTTEGVQGTHSAHASLGVAGLQEIRVPLEPDDAEVDALLAQIADVGKRPVVLMRRAHIYASQGRAIERLVRARPDAVLVSAREPFDAAQFGGARDVLCIYGDDEPSMEGLRDVLYGGAEAEGVLPLEIAAV